MNLLTAKKKFIRNLTILTLGISVFTMLIFQLFFPEHYFVCYPFIPLYFYLSGLIFSNVFTFVYRYDEKKVLPAFLVFRGIKFFLTLSSVIVCGFVARQHIVGFGLIIAAYYLIYLIIETYFFFRVESETK